MEYPGERSAENDNNNRLLGRVKLGSLQTDNKRTPTVFYNAWRNEISYKPSTNTLYFLFEHFPHN